MSHLIFNVTASNRDLIRVDLSGVESDVRLLDYSNYQAFRRGQRFWQEDGGRVRSSPVVLRPPRYGHWYVIVQPCGGTVRASAAIISNAA